MGLKENRERRQHLTREAEAAGGADRVKKQRAQGRMTARERVEFLLDRGSFVELDKFKTHRITDFEMADKKIPGDGVVTGYGTIDGRLGLAREMLKPFEIFFKTHFSQPQ